MYYHHAPPKPEGYDLEQDKLYQEALKMWVVKKVAHLKQQADIQKDGENGLKRRSAVFAVVKQTNKKIVAASWLPKAALHAELVEKFGDHMTCLGISRYMMRVPKKTRANKLSKAKNPEKRQLQPPQAPFSI